MPNTFENMGVNTEKITPEKWIPLLGHINIQDGRDIRQITISIDEKNGKQYNINNGRITRVDEHGYTYVAPYTTDREAELIGAGYRNDEKLWVLFSNGERPFEPTLLARWENMSREADEQNKKITAN